MRHALVTLRYSEQMAVAKQLTREEALEQFLRTYLAQAVYALPTVLAKHLDLSEAELRAGLGPPGLRRSGYFSDVPRAEGGLLCMERNLDGSVAGEAKKQKDPVG